MHQEPSLATLLLAERITTKTLAIVINPAALGVILEPGLGEHDLRPPI